MLFRHKLTRPKDSRLFLSRVLGWRGCDMCGDHQDMKGFSWTFGYLCSRFLAMATKRYQTSCRADKLKPGPFH